MLDSYLVKVGVKGQEVVLSEMVKIRKKGDDLSKKKLAVELAGKPTEKKRKKKQIKTVRVRINFLSLLINLEIQQQHLPAVLRVLIPHLLFIPVFLNSRK